MFAFFRTKPRKMPVLYKSEFSDDVRETLAAARSEATRLKHEYTGTEHILLGLLVRGTRGSEVMAALGVDASEMRGRIEATCPVGTVSLVDLPYTSRSKKVMELALTYANEVGITPVSVECLVAGLLLERKGIGAQTLAASGITMESVDTVVREQPPAAFRVRLSDSSDEPITAQIVKQVAEAIAVGQLKPGMRMPAVRRLADDLEIAPGTVARAYAELERAGAVNTDGARGTTVAARPPQPLTADERVQVLIELLRPVAVQGFHLGATAGEMNKALEQAIDGVQLQ